ncbi:MAG TPA: phosphotransferase [Kineosporiaceae bacterium]|nr:phosphotransferase [Kineosporiaceae bacterium]
MAELTLTSESSLVVIAEPGGWRLELQDGRSPGTSSEPSADPTSDVGAGASRWLVDQLIDGQETLLPGGFQLHRFGPPATSPPPGERSITSDQTNRSVVIGEQLVVKWLHRVDDVENPVLRTLRQLAEVGFDAVPPSFGALTWRAPSARDLPCALVTGFLPGAVGGWQWCVEALESGQRPSFAAELGSLVAKLHVALGTPSALLPLPMLAVGTAQMGTWHSQARQRLDDLAEQISALDDAPAGRFGTRPRQVPSAGLAGHRKEMESVLDRLLDVRGRTPVQLIHGDLHVGQILSRPGGLSVIDFDGSPVRDVTTAERQPAARDVAQLLLSIDHVGRIVDRRSGFTRTAEINAWSTIARAEFLATYRAELAQVERPDVLDTRLLAPFLVDQVARDLLYAIRFLPRWGYATIDALETILNDLPVPLPPPEQVPK